MEVEAYLEAARARIEPILAELLPPADSYPPRIHEAMRYAVLGGGKRLRPILVLASTELVGGRAEAVLPAAAALELIHASTLLLDDLPSMDDAQLRRGRPTAHRVYGESTAILASVALLVHAFDLIASLGSELRLGRERLARVIHETATATGAPGLVGGQFRDLEIAGQAADLRTLEYVHSRKTGQLFVLAATLGPLLTGAREEDLAALANYARNLGLAYQIVDDLLDREGSSAETGKDQGKDRDRTTFATLVEPDDARRLVRELTDTARDWIRPFGRKAAVLEGFAHLLIGRRS